ncbi:MAG: hypothetical protein RL095_3332 [Verrucomicrobiota bacterium]|jgi:hypothetical protein
MKAEPPSLFRRIVAVSVGLHIVGICIFVGLQILNPPQGAGVAPGAPEGGGGSGSGGKGAEAQSSGKSTPLAATPEKEYDVDTQRDINFDDEEKMIEPLKRKALGMKKHIDKMTPEQKLATVASSGAVLRNSDPAGVNKAAAIGMKAFGLNPVAAPPTETVPQALGTPLDDKTLTITNMYRKGGKVYSVYRDAVGHTFEIDNGPESELDAEDKRQLLLYDQARANPNLLALINAVNRAGTAIAVEKEKALDAAPISP